MLPVVVWEGVAVVRCFLNELMGEWWVLKSSFLVWKCGGPAVCSWVLLGYRLERVVVVPGKC